MITQRGSSAETSNTITINASENATANVTISDVNINTSDAAVFTKGKGNVNIELDGTNTLKSSNWHAGLEKNNDGKLTITDKNENGKLIATGSRYGASEGVIGKVYRFQFRNPDSLGPFSYGQVMTDRQLGKEWWHQEAAGGGSMLPVHRA